MSKLASLSLDHQITITLLAAEVTGMSDREKHEALLKLYHQQMIHAYANQGSDNNEGAIAS